MDPNENTPTITTATPPPINPGDTTDSASKKHNPFLPFRNPSTGNWHSPHYSLRRQAVLFKLAQKHSVLDLMPLSPKHPEVKEQKRLEQGVRVKGTGVGQKVKGKLWERTLRGRLESRRKAMEGMPEMIRLWKERGHGRGWKKWPR
jgi:large subunit ribosomal protein L25